MKKFLWLILFASLLAQADINTPTDPLEPLFNMQIQHSMGSHSALLRWTKKDNTKYCQKVQFADFNAAMNSWFSNTGTSFMPVMEWYSHVVFTLPVLTISQDEINRCWSNWR